MINILKEFELKNLTTFKIGGKAKFFAEVSTLPELAEASEFAKEKKLSVFVLGGGSDILMGDKGFDGLVIKIAGKSISKRQTDQEFYLTADAGVNWDDLVEYSVNSGLYGIECLSGIPGTVGASPVQNIGAYGQELKNTFYSLKAYDIKSSEIKEFLKEDCEFGYRESVFKKPEYKGRFIIFEVTFKLFANPEERVFYESLKKYFEEKGISNPNLREVRDAVLTIRKGKFENPDEVGNAGSFFKNPLVSRQKIDELKSKYESLPCYDNGDGTFKCFAGWFIEEAGWKGKRLGNAAVSPKHALVLINPDGNAKAKDIKKLSGRIISDVQQKFDITLEPEVQFVNVD